MTIPRPEYPRPHFDRSHSWRSLNGDWDFLPDPTSQWTAPPEPVAFNQRIVVPFAWETEASGVGLHWLPSAWYRTRVDIPSEWAGQRVVLHFGAVHHLADVWVGGAHVGTHEGGYTPFEIDVTDALAGQSSTDVVVRVMAPSDKRHIVHGKQRSIPRDDYDVCAFTPSSGIWQSVWLEARPATFVRAVALTPLSTLDGIAARVELDGAALAGATLRLTVDALTTTVAVDGRADIGLTLPVRTLRLWSPADPYLYPVEVRLESADGADTVMLQTGLRTVETRDRHLLLNGERVYVRGVLDQGYWPRTGITAPNDDAFVRDLELAREAGFTVVRKHLKLEDPRFLFHADRLGMLVWAEPASTGAWSTAAVRRFEAQIEPMLRRDANHPCIIIWGLYNEEWGLDWDVPGDPTKQQALERAYRTLTGLDGSRPVIDNSGWSHVRTDLLDWHIYDDTPAGWAAKVESLLARRAPSFKVGIGPGVVVDKPLQVRELDQRDLLPVLNSEFGGGLTPVERGWNLRWQTLELRKYDDLAGYVWTELYDVEHEMAGIYDAERRLKDTGGNPPRWTNADTVLIPGIEPTAPGLDAVLDGGRLRVEVTATTHRPLPFDAELVTVWGVVMTVLPDKELRDGVVVAAMKVEPYQRSAPVVVDVTMPTGMDAARLHLVLRTADGVEAVTVLDVIR